MAYIGTFKATTKGPVQPKFRAVCELQYTETDNDKGYFVQKRYYLEVSVAATVATSITVSWGPVAVNIKEVGIYAISEWIDVGWVSSGSKVSYSCSAKYTTGDVTYESSLSSSYTMKDERYTIEYDANGGLEAPSSQYIDKNGSVVLSKNIPFRKGYQFLYWSNRLDDTGIRYNPGSTYNTNSNIVLYAIWEIKKVTVTFEKNDGSDEKKEIVYTYGKTNPPFNDNGFKRDNYALLGWGTSSTQMENLFSVNFVVTDEWIDASNSKITLYAIWSNIESTVPLYLKVSGKYVRGTPYVKVDGIYKKAVHVYTKVNGKYI